MDYVIENIIALRKEHKMTLADMAEKLGIAVSNYRRIETKGTQLTLERLYQIAELFNVSVEDLLKKNTNHVYQKDFHDMVANMAQSLEINNLRRTLFSEIIQSNTELVKNYKQQYATAIDELVDTLYQAFVHWYLNISPEKTIRYPTHNDENIWKQFFSFRSNQLVFGMNLVNDPYFVEKYEKYKSKIPKGTTPFQDREPCIVDTIDAFINATKANNVKDIALFLDALNTFFERYGYLLSQKNKTQ